MKRKNIFLVDGASGTGKSDLIEYVDSMAGNCGVLRKLTTRPIRDYEKKNDAKLDLIFISKSEFDSQKLEYQYTSRGYLYGFSKIRLNEMLNKFENVFIIIRNIKLMRRIQYEFGLHKVIKVYVHCDTARIQERLINQGYGKEQILYRLSRIEETYQDYVLNSSFFDEVIVNDSDKMTYHHLIDNLIHKYSPTD